MLTNIKPENDCQTLLEKDSKYDNQLKKRRLNKKTPEKNNIISSLPTSSPPRSPTSSYQSFNNIVIKTPNISRILSHLSIRTPKKNIQSNASSPLNLLKSLHNARGESDPLLSTNIFIQTPQPSQPSSPSAASKKDQKVGKFPKEFLQNRIVNFKNLKNVTTPKSMRSINLNSTPTKSLNLELSLTPSKRSENTFNDYPASPTSSFIVSTPTKGKSKSFFMDNDNGLGCQEMDWLKNFNSFNSEDNEESIFKYKRMNSNPILNSKDNEFGYRDCDAASLSSFTDDSLSTNTSSSSFNFFNHHAKRYNKNIISKKNRKGISSKLINSKIIENLPLSPELSYLRPNSFNSSSLDKDDSSNRMQLQINKRLDLNLEPSSSINIISNKRNQDNQLSESLSSSSTSSFLLKNNNLSFLSSVNNDIFNQKNSLKMDIISEIESNSDTLHISDISMFIDEEDGNDFIPLENEKSKSLLSTTTKNDQSTLTNNTNSRIESSSDNKDPKSNTVTVQRSTANNNKINNKIDELKASFSLQDKEVVSSDNQSKKSSLYNKGFLNTDGIWEDPSLSQREARNLKDSSFESDNELDEDLEKSNYTQSLPSTPKMKYMESGSYCNSSSSSTVSTPRYVADPKNKSNKNHLKKSNRLLLLNMDGTSSSVSLEKHHTYPNLNSPLRQSFNKEKQFTAINKINLKTPTNKPYRRTNSVGSYHSSSSLASTSSNMIINNINNNNNNNNNKSFYSTFIPEKVSSWSIRKRKTLVRSNSISDLSESLSSERKRSFSTLDEDENEYTSDASSIKRSPSSLRKLNARRKGKERMINKIHQKSKNGEEKIKKNGIISSSSSSSSLNRGKEIKKEDSINDDNISIENDDQDLMSISTEKSMNENRNATSNKNKNKNKNRLEGEINESTLYSDPSLTNSEFNEIQRKKKHENKENEHIFCNGSDEKGNETPQPPPIVPREMIFVDEKGNVYNEQNYKDLSNYTKAVIAAELSKRYCRIPLTEILVSNMPEYRQYFDENGQLKPNNYIYVDNDEEEEDEEREKNINTNYNINNNNANAHANVDVDVNINAKITASSNISNNNNNSNHHPLAQTITYPIDIDEENNNNEAQTSLKSFQSHCIPSNINLIRNDANTTIEFRTEPINEEKEMIFESTMSPKGKREWQDITESSLHSTSGAFSNISDDDKIDWNNENQSMEDSIDIDHEEKKGEDGNGEGNTIQKKNKGKSIKFNENKDDENEDVEFVEKIDDKITIIYRTNESKYQLVIPIKLNIYNKKDTTL